MHTWVLRNTLRDFFPSEFFFPFFSFQGPFIIQGFLSASGFKIHPPMGLCARQLDQAAIDDILISGNVFYVIAYSTYVEFSARFLERLNGSHVSNPFSIDFCSIRGTCLLHSINLNIYTIKTMQEPRLCTFTPPWQCG